MTVMMGSMMRQGWQRATTMPPQLWRASPPPLLQLPLLHPLQLPLLLPSHLPMRYR